MSREILRYFYRRYDWEQNLRFLRPKVSFIPGPGGAVPYSLGGSQTISASIIRRPPRFYSDLWIRAAQPPPGANLILRWSPVVTARLAFV